MAALFACKSGEEENSLRQGASSAVEVVYPVAFVGIADWYTDSYIEVVGDVHFIM